MVEVVLLELFAAAQVLKESLRAVNFALDQRPNRVVGTPVQVLVNAVHATRKSTGAMLDESRFCGRLGKFMGRRGCKLDKVFTHSHVSLISSAELGMLFSGNCNVFVASRQMAKDRWHASVAGNYNRVMLERRVFSGVSFDTIFCCKVF